MPRYVVGKASEIPPGERKIIEAGGHSIGVFNVNGEFYALLNHCPHSGGDLCLGMLIGLTTAEVPGGEVRYERAGEFIRCPWHGWEFDIKTGQSWFDPRRMRVRAYPVEVADEESPGIAEGSEADADAPRYLPGGRWPGPLVAEGYEVLSQGGTLVLDTDRRRPLRTQRGIDAPGGDRVPAGSTPPARPHTPAQSTARNDRSS